MKVFVTGATGYIGSAVVADLLAAGHQVIGLARSDQSAAALERAGAEVHRGSLEDLDSLRAGAAKSDGALHIGWHVDLNADFDYARSSALDRDAIQAFCETLEGTNRPLIVSSGTAMTPMGVVGTENDAPGTDSPVAVRGSNEDLALSFVSRGVRSVIMRLPPTVYSSADKKSFIPLLVAFTRAKGVAAYIGDGSNRWATVHLHDAVPLYRLALEKAPAGMRVHGVGEEGVTYREIATALGRNLDVPVVSLTAEEAEEHFGFFTPFVAADSPASSVLTQQALGWKPVRHGLIADIDQGHYFQS